MKLPKAFTLRAKKHAVQRDETSTPYYELADRVDLVRHAHAAGLANLPHESAETPNDVESAIENEFRNRHRAALESARGDLRSITEQFAKLEDKLPSVRDLEVIPTNAGAGLERTLAAEMTIGHARREMQERHRHERGFRRRHGLAREARYPDSKPMHLAIVGVLVVVESVLNMSLFAATSALGIFGGFLVAVSVSLVNAASGVLAGFLPFRHLRNRRLALRVVASVASAAHVLTAVVFNLTVAHYRDLTGLSGTPASAALAATFHHPLALSTLSIGLFILGLIVCAISTWHGFTLDDPCPGFGEVVRARRGAADAFKNANEDLRARGLAPIEAVPTACTGIVWNARELIEQLRDLAVRAQRRVERYETERAHNQHWCTVLLRRYRTENEGVRTARPPAYFKVYPDFPSELNDDVTTKLNARLDRARLVLDQLAAQVHVIGMKQHDRVAAARRQLDGFVSRAVQRADAGRGDDSDANVVDAADESRWAS